GVSRLDSLFSDVVIFGPDSAADVLCDISRWRRLGGALCACTSDSGINRSAVWRYLRRCDALSASLAFAIRDDNPAHVFAVLDRLRSKSGDKLNDYANLVSAICVVHDEPLTRQIHDNKVGPIDPVELLGYFVKNEKRMQFGVRKMPTELLIYVVDSTAPPDQLEWALHQYGNDAALANRYFQITYDYSALQSGKRAVSDMGLTLQNIALVGGVCADQAYFAAHVGKAMGIPTTYTVGAASQWSHAWLEYLEARGSQPVWNAEAGRYEEYRHVCGSVVDPQSRKDVPDADVAILAECSRVDSSARYRSAALCDAAEMLGSTKPGPATRPLVVGTVSGTRRRVRSANVESQLELLEQSLRQNPAHLPAWKLLAKLSGDDRLSLEQKRKWAQVVTKLCGTKYPDFAIVMLRPMIKSVDSPSEEIRFWEEAFQMFVSRPDIAAAVRMEQAALLRKSGKQKDAVQCYTDILTRYSNSGPCVIDALYEAGVVLYSINRQADYLVLCEQTWKRITTPTWQGSPFLDQSNWFRIGTMYADALAQAGRGADA
ncbi:MAG: hypothetical protein ACREJC_06140, partial [Tepidisphaeraceae bacterium]